jgi:hypothetical protein
MMERCQEIAAVLGIAAPAGASESEQAQWIDWWEASARAAGSMSAEVVAALKAGRWWPPLTARQIDEPAPLIVRRTMRPRVYVAAPDSPSLAAGTPEPDPSA